MPGEQRGEFFRERIRWRPWSRGVLIAQLDRGIETLVRQRHAHAPAIRAVPAPMLVDQIVKGNSQQLPVMRGLDPRIHLFARIES